MCNKYEQGEKNDKNNNNKNEEAAKRTDRIKDKQKFGVKTSTTF